MKTNHLNNNLPGKSITLAIICLLLINDIAWSSSLFSLRPMIGNQGTYKDIKKAAAKTHKEKDPNTTRDYYFKRLWYWSGCEEFKERIWSIADAFTKTAIEAENYPETVRISMQKVRGIALNYFLGNIAVDIRDYDSLLEDEKKQERKDLKFDLECFEQAVYALPGHVVRFREAMKVPEISRHLQYSEIYEDMFDISLSCARAFKAHKLNDKQKKYIIESIEKFLRRLTDKVYNMDTSIYSKYLYEVHKIDTNKKPTRYEYFLHYGHDLLEMSLRMCIKDLKGMEKDDKDFILNRCFQIIMEDEYIQDTIEEAGEEIKIKEYKRVYGGAEAKNPKKSESKNTTRDFSYSSPGGIAYGPATKLTLTPQLKQEFKVALLQTTELLVELEIKLDGLIKRRRYIDSDMLEDLMEELTARVNVELASIKGKVELDPDELSQLEGIINVFLRKIEANSWAIARKHIICMSDTDSIRLQIIEDMEINHRCITEKGNTCFEAKDGLRLIAQDTMYLIKQFSLTAILLAFDKNAHIDKVIENAPAAIAMHRLSEVIPQKEIQKTMEEDRLHFLMAGEELYGWLLSVPDEYSLWGRRDDGYKYISELESLIDDARKLKDWPKKFDKQVQAYFLFYTRVVAFTKKLFDPETHQLLKNMDEDSLTKLYKRSENVQIKDGFMCIGGLKQEDDKNNVHKAVIIKAPESGVFSTAEFKVEYIVLVGGFTHSLMLREGLQCYAIQNNIVLNNTDLKEVLGQVSYVNAYIYDIEGEDYAIAYKFNNIKPKKIRKTVKDALDNIGFKGDDIEIKKMSEESVLESIGAMNDSAVDSITASRFDSEQAIVSKYFELAEKGFKFKQPGLIEYTKSQLKLLPDSARMYAISMLPSLIEGISIAGTELGEDYDVNAYVGFIYEFGGKEVPIELRAILKDEFVSATLKADAICALGYMPDEIMKSIPEILELSKRTDSFYLKHTLWDVLSRIAESSEILQAGQILMENIKKAANEAKLGQYKEFIDTKIKKLDTVFDQIAEMTATDVFLNNIDTIVRELAGISAFTSLVKQDGYDEAVRLFGDINRVSYLLANYLNVLASHRLNGSIREKIFLEPLDAKIDRIENAVGDELEVLDNLIKPTVYQLLFLATQSVITSTEFSIRLKRIANGLSTSGYDEDMTALLIQHYYRGDFFSLSEDEKNWFNIVLIDALLGEEMIRDKDVLDLKDINEANKPSLEDVEVIDVCPKFFLDFRADLTNPAGPMQTSLEPGGSGSNISRILKNTKTPFRLLGFKGGVTGRIVANLLEKYGVSTSDLISSYGSVLVSAVIREGPLQIMLKPKPEAHMVSLTERRKLLFQIDKIIADICEIKTRKEGYNPVFLLTGTLPNGIGDDFYALVVNKCREKGIKAIVDTHGKELLKAMESRPLLVKPNEQEFEELVNDFAESKADEIALAFINQYYDTKNKKWLGESRYKDYAILASYLREQTGVENILITLGKKGAVWVSEEKSCYIPQIDIPDEDIKSTVGAGDTVVSIIAKKIAEGAGIKEAIAYGMYGSKLTIQEPGPGVVKSWEDIEKFKETHPLKMIDVHGAELDDILAYKISI